MKKILMVGVVLLIIFLVAGPALAWRGHSRGHFRGRSHFGIFIGPPVFFVPPPPVYHRYYYPRDYYYPGDRVWVPGYWDYRETPFGWERVWIPGHWEWR
jgi:hypothetical protein